MNPFNYIKNFITNNKLKLKNISTVITNVVAYGILTWPVLITFFNFPVGWMSIVHILGSGAGWVLFFDLIKYVGETFRK